jgi:hypothetical protein
MEIEHIHRGEPSDRTDLASVTILGHPIWNLLVDLTSAR